MADKRNFIPVKTFTRETFEDKYPTEYPKIVPIPFGPWVHPKCRSAETHCPHCGLPHPESNPYCFCLGMKVVEDVTVPKDEVQFKICGQIVGRIVNLKE